MITNNTNESIFLMIWHCKFLEILELQDYLKILMFKMSDSLHTAIT